MQVFVLHFYSSLSHVFLLSLQYAKWLLTKLFVTDICTPFLSFFLILIFRILNRTNWSVNHLSVFLAEECLIRYEKKKIALQCQKWIITTNKEKKYMKILCNFEPIAFLWNKFSVLEHFTVTLTNNSISNNFFFFWNHSITYYVL